MPISGLTLSNERLRAHIVSRRVTQTAVAKLMGISRQTLYTLEQSAQVDQKYVDAHRKAVQTLRDAKDEAA